jgi:glutathione S-transferase
MKLYNFDASPYASRVRLAIKAKGLRGIEIITPEGGPRSPAYLAINPIGKVPALVLADGTVIVESQVIVEYLEETHPEPRLLPSTPEARARMRILVRIADLYLGPAGGRVFGQLDPAKRDAAAVDGIVRDLRKGLSDLEHFLTGDRFAAAGILTQADCALVPMIFYVDLGLPLLGIEGEIARHPKLAAWWERIRTEPIVAELLGELQAGYERMMAARASS